MRLTMTTPFNTAMPNRAMKPTHSERFRLVPRSYRAAMPPTSATGTIQRISHICFALWKVA
jgi:hypothetical protein